MIDGFMAVTGRLAGWEGAVFSRLIVGLHVSL